MFGYKAVDLDASIYHNFMSYLGLTEVRTGSEDDNTNSQCLR